MKTIVYHARILDLTRSEFAEPALKALRKWVFRPGQGDGVAVPCR
jgi:hypothetical protein